ncbi:hypothetical protein MOUN0_O03796 [Monosporozyma unispora]
MSKWLIMFNGGGRRRCKLMLNLSRDLSQNLPYCKSVSFPFIVVKLCSSRKLPWFLLLHTTAWFLQGLIPSMLLPDFLFEGFSLNYRGSLEPGLVLQEISDCNSLEEARELPYLFKQCLYL